MRSLSLVILFLLFTVPVFASDDYSAWWQTGNRFYEQKNYDSAAFYYNKIAAQEPHNAEIYYNMGNAYYRLNDIGNAVLNYQRALKYDPGHSRASDNLYLAQSRIANRIQEVPQIFFVRWWENITAATYANTYAVIALVLFLLLIGYYIARIFGKVPVHVPVQLSVGAGVLIVLFIALGIVAANRFNGGNNAVVMQGDAPLMVQPKYGKSQSLVPEGTTVEICGEKAGWYEVTLPDGRDGWLQRTAVTKI